MLAAERQREILKFISQTKTAAVEELAAKFGVSAMTIRRDLDKLKYSGKVERCHGGVVVRGEVDLLEKSIRNQWEKGLIAKKCLELINEHQTIFLDSGSTVYEIAKLICDREDLTIVTNDLKTASLLWSGNVMLMVCGGLVQRSTGSVIGPFAEEMIHHIRFDLSFMVAACIDENMDVLTPTVEKAFFKREVMKKATQNYLVVDGEKFGKRSLIQVCELGQYTGIITEKIFTQEEKKEFEKRQIKIIQAR